MAGEDEMSELAKPRELKDTGESQELRDLANRMDLSAKNFPFNKEGADIRVTKRLELPKPSGEINSFNASEFDEKYVKELTIDLKECNPNHDLGRKWQVNCQRCAPAFELRRRGYDVTVKPREDGWDLSGLSNNPFLVWKNPEVINARGNGKHDIERNMAKWGDGSRAEIVVMWNNSPMGHAFFAERVNGKTRFYDPQNGSADVSDYFNRVRPGSVRFCRVDNLDFNEKINDCCRWRV